jgi:CRP-like cAMP-binding protein
LPRPRLPTTVPEFARVVLVAAPAGLVRNPLEGMRVSSPEPSGSATAPGAHAIPVERGCGRLLSTLRGMGVPLVPRRHGRGVIIHDEKEAGRAFYTLAGGAARLYVGHPGYAGGKRAAFLLLGSGDAFGSALFCGGGPGRVSAEAFTDCEVVKIPEPFLERALRHRPEVALEVAALLERRLVEYEELVGCLLSRKTEVRLARLLPVLARKFGERDGDGGVAIGLRLTRTDLAEMTASTRESVTAAVSALREKGILTMDEGRIAVLDPEGLAGIGGR